MVIAVWIAAAAFAAVDGELELAARNLGASPLRTARDVTLPLAMPGLVASAIFVFLESLDEFTGPISSAFPTSPRCPHHVHRQHRGNYQIARSTARCCWCLRSGSCSSSSASSRETLAARLNPDGSAAARRLQRGIGERQRFHASPPPTNGALLWPSAAMSDPAHGDSLRRSARGRNRAVYR